MHYMFYFRCSIFIEIEITREIIVGKNAFLIVCYFVQHLLKNIKKTQLRYLYFVMIID